MYRFIEWLGNRCSAKWFLDNHAGVFEFNPEQKRMQLRCVHCLRISPGWDIRKSEPSVVTQQSLAAREATGNI